MPDIELFCQHGWGFNCECWELWAAHPSCPGLVLAPDRGYLGNPCSMAFSEGARHKIVVTHSYGLFLIPDEALKQADAIVIIGGFQSFHPPGREGRRSSMLVRLMQKQLRVNPMRVISSFYGAFASSLAPHDSQSLNVDLLIHDLHRLSADTLSLVNIEQIPYVLIFHGQKDRIVAPEKARTLQTEIPESRLFMMPDADHALPFTHTDWCMEVLLELIEEMDNCS